MLRNGAHGVVADSCGYCTAHPGWIAEERIETTIAAIVEVNVDAAIKNEDEVSDRIGTLDIEGV